MNYLHPDPSPTPRLRVRCLATTPIEEREVEKLYESSSVTTMEREELVFRIRRLCLSHERLRAELQGAEKIIQTMDRKQQHGCTDASCKECDQ